MCQEALRANFAQPHLFQSITLYLAKSFLALFGDLHFKSRTEGSCGFRKMSWHFFMEGGRPRPPKLRRRRPVALHGIGQNVPPYFPPGSGSLNLASLPVSSLPGSGNRLQSGLVYGRGEGSWVMSRLKAGWVPVGKTDGRRSLGTEHLLVRRFCITAIVFHRFLKYRFSFVSRQQLPQVCSLQTISKIPNQRLF